MHNTPVPIDKILGPSDGRFFGSRYATVIAELGPLNVDTCDGTTATGTASVSFDGLWSRKGTQTVVPHVSTIDVVALAGQVSERLLGPDDNPNTEWLVRQISLRAGRVPVECGFDSLPVTATITRNPDGARVHAEIANFTVDVTLEWRATTRHSVCLVPSAVYEAIYRARTPRLGNVTIDENRAVAQCSVDGLAGAWAEHGVDRGRGGRLNLIDAFVVVLQLGQVLLYQQDALARADSNTLWMRSTTLRATWNRRSTSKAAVSLKDPRVVATGGDKWRLATITGDLDGLFQVDCSVGHKLPSSTVDGLASGASQTLSLVGKGAAI